jgi:hypothetical protein
VPLAKLRARFALHPGHIDGTLDADGNPMQRTKSITTHNARLSVAGLIERTLAVHLHEGIDFGIYLLDALKMRPNHFDRGKLSPSNLLRHLRSRKKVEIRIRHKKPSVAERVRPCGLVPVL